MRRCAAGRSGGIEAGRETPAAGRRSRSGRRPCCASSSPLSSPPTPTASTSSPRRIGGDWDPARALGALAPLASLACDVRDIRGHRGSPRLPLGRRERLARGPLRPLLRRGLGHRNPLVGDTAPPPVNVAAQLRPPPPPLVTRAPPQRGFVVSAPVRAVRLAVGPGFLSEATGPGPIRAGAPHGRPRETGPSVFSGKALGRCQWSMQRSPSTSSPGNGSTSVNPRSGRSTFTSRSLHSIWFSRISVFGIPDMSASRKK
jgi:hypothetical protein